MRREDLTGHRFGTLVAMEIAPSVKGETKWVCRCDCGKTLAIYTKALTRGMTTSCGHMKERHGASESVEYSTFRRMKDRCTNPKNADFSIYGGRGIQVRFLTFASFLSEIGTRPSAKHSVDRINTNGHYEPGNVRWSTARAQANNMRVNRPLTWNGETLNLAEWGRKTGLGREVIEKRIDALGWSIDRALSTPKSSQR